MAQLGGVQREPSMEEILASIRRIIEDSDAGRKPEDADAANDVPEAAKVDPGLPANPVETGAGQPGTVIEVEAFRADLRNRPEPRKPVSLAEVQAHLAADGALSRGMAGIGRPQAANQPDHEKTAPEASEPVAPRRIPDVDEWRLGIPAAADAQGDAEDDMFAEEIASAVMEDMPSGPDLAAEPAISGLSEAATDAPRPALLSETAGKQVAAAFGELSEAFAARSRRNLDEMAEAMLRPMLQDWLDNNLPLLVEKLVREEIERVARGS